MKTESIETKPCSLTLDDRSRAVVSGVKSVASFDEMTVALETHAGRLVITGTGLHADSLQPAEERMTISGAIDGAAYEDSASGRRRNFLRHALGR